MSTASEQTIGMLEEVVQPVGVGTNLGLVHRLWTIMSGAFLVSRGALFPALQRAGFSAEQSRRAGQALRQGVWSIAPLLAAFRARVEREGVWQPTRYEGDVPVAADVTVFWRPRLQGGLGKFYQRLANRAVSGIGVGLVVQVGRVGAQRLPLLKQLVRPLEAARSDQGLQQQVLRAAARQLGPDEVLVYDAGASVAEMQAAVVARYGVRRARNCTARRNCLPERPAGKGRPREYGQLVRPLARQHKGRRLAATAPDQVTTFQFQERLIPAQGWHGLVRADQKVAPDQPHFSIWLFTDPLYREPLVVATNLSASPATIFGCYHDRWPVEQVPLVAKQLLGLQRHFVFAPTSCQRLPELALLTANILTYLAALLPPITTGFWDRAPSRTPGRLRRHLAQEGFSRTFPSAGRLREKAAVTDHLPKGVAAHRRHKAA
ncbi:MAG: hypothetical protein M5U01_09900 [Ardenticatenaceae bacterium]|nr:hypothetical protein [Ardenticatenaceae bacterium]